MGSSATPCSGSGDDSESVITWVVDIAGMLEDSVATVTTVEDDIDCGEDWDCPISIPGILIGCEDEGCMIEDGTLG